MKSFSVIVIGAGHAGVEAALAPARMGVETLMINLSFDTIGVMSCNPAIGGVGKGQLVREVDMLGGEMGRAADYAGIQFRQLNASKGQAVRSSRCQADRVKYREYLQEVVKRQEHLTFYKGEVVEILFDGKTVTGVKTADGKIFEASKVIVTVGTFLDGRMHLGPKIISGGRLGEIPSVSLARSLEKLGLVLRTFKTGTPPRLDGKTINYSNLQRQDSDDVSRPFSYHSKDGLKDKELLPCWITYTRPETHQIIKDNFHLSPMYSGQIDATGVRYCPSIEDKLKKFSDKGTHHVFLEPEGLDTNIVYPNGISTGLPEDVQEAFVRTIPGLETCKIVEYGYSIEHAVIYAEELKGTLECKHIEGLYMAGQINGTTGYEEAAAQGVVAGINTVLKLKGEDPFVLGRDEAYAGVLIDDLITKGTEEPYRMFTSRVEHRLLVREDNTDYRLCGYAHKFGLMSDEVYTAIQKKYQDIAKAKKLLAETLVKPKDINPVLIAKGSPESSRSLNLLEVLRRPGLSLEDVVICQEKLQGIPKDVAEQIEYEVKYEGFIARQRKEVEKFRHLENIKIPLEMSFKGIPSLSIEIQQKLEHFRPTTLGQANRISGVTPSAISVLMVYLKKYFSKKRDN